MTDQRCRTVFLLLCLILGETLSSEPFTYTINTKKWSHVLDDHFISVTINPTDLLQGKAFGLGMNSTVAILKGLSPAYIRIGSADTGKYTFKRSRYSSDVARTEDEFIITESHWTVLNEVVRSAGLDLIVCLNSAHRTGGSRKWDTRNSLELISFSDSQGYNLTFQLGYEVQRNSDITGHQYGKDLNRLRTILNAFPRYQNSKLIGPDIRYLSKREDVEFVNDVLSEAGQTLDAVTWHPRWPQPSKMKVSDISELGYEFPSDYLEWDRSQIGKMLQRSVLKNPIWIGEPKTESTGTFAEGLLWARRLVLAAKVGIEVVMKQPSLMDISHPKPEYWIAYLHKRLLGKAVLETRPQNNQTEIAMITHCTNSLFWADRPHKALEGSVTLYAVNMGGKEQKVHLKGNWGGKSQIMLQYLLTSGSDPDSVFSQMTYLNGEPLMMTDDGNLPELPPRVRRIERGVTFKLPPYSVGFWVVPEARVKICQVQPAPITSANTDNQATTNAIRPNPKNVPNIRNLNQLLVDKLKNPISESDEELYDDRVLSDDSSDRDMFQESAETPVQRASRRVRQVTMEDIGQELKNKIREIRDMLETKGNENQKAAYSPEVLRAAEEKISALTDELGTATRMNDQKEEFGRFLHQAGLNKDFGALMMTERLGNNPGFRRSIERSQWLPRIPTTPSFTPLDTKIRRFRRSLSYPEDDYEDESIESSSSEEEVATEAKPPFGTVAYRKRISRYREDSDEGSNNSVYSASPAVKSLEEKYKSFRPHKVQDGRKKLNDLRKPKKNDTEEEKKPGAKKSSVLGNDLQEEILMKEVEVLQKTEEAMANLIKNHKKRQQTIEEIILHEISDIKEDRLTALEDMRQHKEMIDDNSIEYQPVPEEIPERMRGSVLDVLQSTKVKRSIPEGESSLNVLENSPEDKKKEIIKRSLDSSFERGYRRRKSRKAHRDEDERSNRPHRKSRSERLERMKNFIQSRERIRDRNGLRKKYNRKYRKYASDGSDEDTNEILGDYDTRVFDKTEDMVIKEIQKEILKKPERKTTQDEVKKVKEEEPSNEKEQRIQKEEKKTEKSTSKNIVVNKEVNVNSAAPVQNYDSANENQRPRPKTEEKKTETNQENRATSKKNKSEEEVEYVPLKMDKNRGLNVLKRISNFVENINRDKLRSRKTMSDMDDMSEEFFGDSISRITKKRHRRSHHRDGDEEEESSEPGSDSVTSEVSEELSEKDAKALRKEIRKQKLMERRSRRKKLNNSDQSVSGSKARRIARLEAKLAKLSPSETPTATTEEVVAATEVTQIPTEKVDVTDKSEKVEAQLNDESRIDKAPIEKVNNEEKIENSVHEESVEMAEPKLTTTDIPQTTTIASVMLKKEPPPQETTTVNSMTTTSPAPDAVMVVPEMEGVYYNPVVLANPTEDILADAPAGEAEPLNTEILLVNPYTGEKFQVSDVEDFAKHSLIEPEYEFPVEDGQPVADPKSEDAYSDELLPDEDEMRTSFSLKDLIPHGIIPEDKNDGNGPPNLIAELMEGESLKPWKGVEDQARADKQYAHSQLRHSMFDTVKEIFSGEEQPNIEAGEHDILNEDAHEQNRAAVVAESLTSGSPEGTTKTKEYLPTIAEQMSIDDGVEIPIEESDNKKLSKKSSRRVRRGILDRRLLTPEERIRNFKRMAHRRHAPFTFRNEVPISNEGESFWKMAGSTVKAVFNDVIPEAYGKTKNKIENLGIAEYFKEFGKIVEQMKNLDRLFANIGQAAVRNYIKGTEDEKGDYIQVIERKRRSRRDVEELLITDSPEDGKEMTESVPEETTASPEVTTTTTTTPATTPTTTPTTTTMASIVRTTKRKGLRTYAKERPNDLIRDIFLMDSNPGIVEVTKAPPVTEPPRTLPLHPFESRYAKMAKLNYLNKFMAPKSSRDGRTLEEQEIHPPALQKFAPWMKTTKDFINQALTTLQRQRELSEMIARESVNDLVKREIERKVIGKREIPDDQGPFPVYQMPANRKREIQEPIDEVTSRYMDRLQPGVYIIPTKEMKNLRSEQIMKEAPPSKPGMPNMVTLNIYYDKKNPNEWESSRDEVEDTPKVGPTPLRYYQAPDYQWSPVPPQPPPHYIPPYPEGPLDNGYIPPPLDSKLQGPLHSRLLHYPEHYHEVIAAAQRGYPINRSPPTYYYPEDAQYVRTKSDWADLKPHHMSRSEMNPFGNNQIAVDSGWAVQLQPAKKKPGRGREPIRPVNRAFPDKKRSIGDDKMDPSFSGLALPFWKFFTPKMEQVESSKTPADSNESNSTEELFAENRRRAEAKKKGGKPEEKKEKEDEGKSRRKRDVTLVELEDIVPDWIGTVQDLDNTLHEQHDELERLARIVPLSGSDCSQDYSLLPGRDLEFLRKRRSADATEHPPSKPVLKKINSEDSSLEVPTNVVDQGSHSGNKTETNTHGKGTADDPLTQFFKYAYESLIQMMKGMTDFI